MLRRHVWWEIVWLQITSVVSFLLSRSPSCTKNYISQQYSTSSAEVLMNWILNLITCRVFTRDTITPETKVNTSEWCCCIFVVLLIIVVTLWSSICSSVSVFQHGVPVWRRHVHRLNVEMWSPLSLSWRHRWVRLPYVASITQLTCTVVCFCNNMYSTVRLDWSCTDKATGRLQYSIRALQLELMLISRQ